MFESSYMLPRLVRSDKVASGEVKVSAVRQERVKEARTTRSHCPNQQTLMPRARGRSEYGNL